MKYPFLVLLFFSIFAKGQVNEYSKPSRLVSNIITKFNRNQFREIYELADSGFKANVSENDIIGLLSSAATLGKIKKCELVSRDDNGLSYRIFFDKKSLMMDISTESDSTFSRFGLRPYKISAIKNRNDFRFDNPMISHLDSLVQKEATSYMNNENIAGLTVGVFVKGEMYTFNFGETAKGNGIIPSKNTIYEIGSITKVFTGILLANAVLEKKINLNDDIRKFFKGDFPNLEYSGQPIRVVNLSNHTSGLPFTVRLPDTNEDPFDPSVQFDDSMLLKILHAVKLDTTPGMQRNYSNLGVAILGKILEKIYGMSYEQLLTKYILKPFGMNQTKVLLSKDKTDKMAVGYDIEGNETAYWHNKFAEPAGGIHSTAHDMLLFIKNQISGSNNASNLSHKITFGDAMAGIGLNWDIYTTKKGYLRWAHEGGTDGFSSLLMIYPELKSGIILLTNNGDHDDQTFYNIGTAIYLYLSGK
jgi:CubicO group peptidase (beta-lactamase class C family)